MGDSRLRQASTTVNNALAVVEIGSHCTKSLYEVDLCVAVLAVRFHGAAEKSRKFRKESNLQQRPICSAPSETGTNRLEPERNSKIFTFLHMLKLRFEVRTRFADSVRSFRLCRTNFLLLFAKKRFKKI